MFAQDPTPTTSGTAAEAGAAKKDDIQGAVRSPDFLFYSVLLAALLFVCAAVFYAVDRWRKGRPTGEGDREASLSLSSFREMYENGEITEAEYHKVRDKLAAKMKAKVGLPPVKSPTDATSFSAVPPPIFPPGLPPPDDPPGAVK